MHDGDMAKHPLDEGDGDTDMTVKHVELVDLTVPEEHETPEKPAVLTLSTHLYEARTWRISWATHSIWLHFWTSDGMYVQSFAFSVIASFSLLIDQTSYKFLA